MNRTTAKWLLILAVLLLLAGRTAAAPSPSEDHFAYGSVSAPAQPGQRSLAQDRVSLDEAAAMVRRQTGGRIIKASSRSSNGRTVHFIRVLTRDGKVFTVRVDAASGRVL
ncbi:MAG: hypothetical protein HKN59_07020 [Gammaproteobacteria bacterium]|nr:hypothetical protein [Gammaproteobacteria bacterium]